MEKSYARSRILKLRGEMSSEECASLSYTICRKFLDSPEYKNASSILMYKAYNNEVDTELIFDRALHDGKTVAYPRSSIIDGEPELSFYTVSDRQCFVSGYKGIMEPDDECEIFEGLADICITPGVAFDRNCHRVGYGKAFYDRYLRVHDIKTVIALAYDIQIVDMIEVSDKDISPDMVITETSVYKR